MDHELEFVQKKVSQLGSFNSDNIILFNLTARVAASSYNLGIDIDLIGASLALPIKKL